MAVNADQPDPDHRRSCFDQDDEHYFYHQDANCKLSVPGYGDGPIVEHYQ